MVADAEQALSARASSDVVRAAVSTILAAYRTPDFLDPAAFVRMATEALEDCPAVTLFRLASPKTGIVRTAKWPPTIAELVAWCDADIEPMKNAIGLSCRQIERCKSAEREAAAAIERAAEKARQQAEWDAGAPERQRRAEEAAKLAREAAERHDREEAIRVKRNQVRAAWMAQVCKAVNHDAILTERMYSLLADDDVSDQATDFEASMPGSGSRFVLAKMGAVE
jgi:hypothetical protein